MSGPNFPMVLQGVGDDPRFTFGLIYDVGKVLEAAGYPRVTGADHVELMQALFRFLYGIELPDPATTDDMRHVLRVVDDARRLAGSDGA